MFTFIDVQLSPLDPPLSNHSCCIFFFLCPHPTPLHSAYYIYRCHLYIPLPPIAVLITQMPFLHLEPSLLHPHLLPLHSRLESLCSSSICQLCILFTLFTTVTSVLPHLSSTDITSAFPHLQSTDVTSASFLHKHLSPLLPPSSIQSILKPFLSSTALTYALPFIHPQL